LSNNASAFSKGALLLRAKGYYTQFVKLHTKTDIQAIRAKTALTDIEKGLKKFKAATYSAVGLGGKTLMLSLGKGVTMRLVRIPAGKFVMGSAEKEPGHKENEGPQRLVTITKAFYIGVTAVTQTQYKALTGLDPSSFKGPRNPVECVSYEEVLSFCQAVSDKTGRSVGLPTEAQWEYACRAGTKTRYSFGNSDAIMAQYGWNNNNAGRKTQPVGMKKPNPAGLYDMHGNLWEMCTDWYDENYYAKAQNVDPENTTKAKERVVRGGTWSDKPATCRTAHRHKIPMGSRGSCQCNGFRVIVTLDSKG
jgi:formylglycine-generating enzyme required for sulfatase activity